MDQRWDEGKERAPQLASEGDVLMVGSVNNGIHTLERIHSRLIVEEEIVKKPSGIRRPNTSMQNY